MELKVQKSTNTSYDNSSKNTSKSTGTGFGDILKGTIAKSNSSQTILQDSDKEKVELYKSIGMEAINKLPSKNKADVEFSMWRIGETLGLNPYDYFREDATIDFKKLLHDFGNEHLTTGQLDALNKDLDTLHDNGFITDEDYDYSSKWILSRITAEKIKLQNKEMIATTYKSLVYQKKDK